MSDIDEDVPSADQNTSKQQFIRWVREFDTLESEMKAAGKLLGQMRKRKKQLEEAVKKYMQQNRVTRVNLNSERYLERNIKLTQKGVNAEVIGGVLQQLMNDEEKAAEYTAAIYNARPEEETEILKIATEQPQKRARLRPVVEDGSSMVGV